MARISIELLIYTLVLVLAQVLVFNPICLFGVAVPFVFIFVLLRLPVTLSREWCFTIAFIIGLVIDIFSDTPGMNALSCTLFMALRRPVLRLYVMRDEEITNPCPGSASLGFFTYVKYASTMSLIYCTFIFTIEAFTFLNPLQTALRIVTSALLTSVLLIGIDSLTISRREKRL